jgi:hypothetical protein
MSSLARQFLSDRSQSSGAIAYDLSELKELETMLGSEEVVDDGVLIERLAHLRAALEQHSQADAAVIFNEV